jgi:serine/threonine protein kinase
MIERETTRFWQAALQSGIVGAAQLERCWNEIPPERQTPDAIDRRLARRVVDHGYMTRWQAQQLLAGLRPQGLWFDRYLVQDLIGQGGMGRVYLARDNRLGRSVALKVLSRERMNNPRAMARFRREAKVGAQLQHENLVRIYDEGEVSGTRYLVMEYIEGKPVGKLIAERGPLPAEIAARIARQVAEGLQHAHLKGLVHRDVNPMNILIDRDGTAKLTDLGLAIDLADQGDAVTRDGATVGTFDYISPEQARHSRSIDTRSDLYSLGCALYHMIAGRVPFPQPSLPEKLYAHQSLAPEPLESIVAGLPPGLSKVIGTMMAKRPEDRYAAPIEAARALAPFQCGPITLAEIEAAPEVPIWIDSGSGSGSGSDSAARVPAPESQGSFPPATPEPAVRGTPHGSDIFDVLPRIDTGPEPPLSGTSSRVPDEPREPRFSRRSLARSAVAILVLVVAAAWLWNRPRAGSTRLDAARPAAAVSGPDTSRPGTNAATRASTHQILVRWLADGSETSHGTILDAVQHVVGRDAEVVLRDGAPIDLRGKSLNVSAGSVVIRAAEGCRPVIVIPPSSPSPAITVGLQGALKLSGLSFRWSGTPSRVDAALIQSAGNLSLERCEFTAPDSAPAVAAVRAQGRRSSFSGCVFRGFENPLRISAYAGTETRLQHCLFLRRPAPDATTPWAVSVDNQRVPVLTENPKVRTDRAPRSLTIDHCTVLGSGLLAATDFTPEMPLRVTLTRSIVEGPALLGWASPSPFPRGLSWSGAENRYAVLGETWVQPRGAGPALENAPRSLESWCQAVTAEPGTAVIPATLLTADRESVESRTVGESAGATPGVGIDPNQVGPG